VWRFCGLFLQRPLSARCDFPYLAVRERGVNGTWTSRPAFADDVGEGRCRRCSWPCGGPGATTSIRRAESSAVFTACEMATVNGVCGAYFNEAACAQLPRYASCSYPDFAAFYDAMADLFCVSGPSSSAGAGGAAGAGP
jgi:hypothetical protein